MDRRVLEAMAAATPPEGTHSGPARGDRKPGIVGRQMRGPGERPGLCKAGRGRSGAGHDSGAGPPRGISTARGAGGPPPAPRRASSSPPGHRREHRHPACPPRGAAAAPALTGRGETEARHDNRDSPRHRAAPGQIPGGRRGPGPLRGLTPTTRAARELGNRPDTGNAQPRSRQFPPARAPSLGRRDPGAR